jgi:hypothetical protein
MRDSMDKLVQRCGRKGYPTAAELIAAQGLKFPRDPHCLLGDFWPEEGSVDDFLPAMREWCGHAKTDTAA